MPDNPGTDPGYRACACATRKAAAAATRKIASPIRNEYKTVTPVVVNPYECMPIPSRFTPIHANITSTRLKIAPTAVPVLFYHAGPARVKHHRRTTE